MADIRDIVIAHTAAKPGIPIPDASESGEAAEAQAPNGYTIGIDDRGWHFITPLGAKSRPWNDRRSAVDGAFDHVENRSPYATESVDTKTRAAPEGWVIEPLSRGEWSIRRLYQNRIEETFATRRDAVDAAWRLAADFSDAPGIAEDENERRAFRGAVLLFLNPEGKSIEFRQRRNEILIETLEAYGKRHARAVAPVDHQSFLDRLVEVAKSKDLDKLPVGYEVKFEEATRTWKTVRRSGDFGIGRVGKYGSEEDAHVAAWKHFYATNSPKNPAQRPSAPVRPLKRTVVLESPYRGKDEEGTLRNVDYARRALADCLSRGEAAFASHLLYTQIGVLDDTVADERERGIRAGYMVGNHLNTVVFYMDHGMSPGMISALEHYTRAGLSTEFRYLDDHDL